MNFQLNKPPFSANDGGPSLGTCSDHSVLAEPSADARKGLGAATTLRRQ